MNCADFDVLLVHYQRGELESPERAQVGVHLGGCAECRHALAEIAEVEALHAELPSPQASPGHMERLRERLATAARAESRRIEVATTSRVARRVLFASLALHAAALVLLSALFIPGPDGRPPIERWIAIGVVPRPPAPPDYDEADDLPLLPDSENAFAEVRPQESSEEEESASPATQDGPPPQQPGRWTDWRFSVRKQLLAESAPWLAKRIGWREDPLRGSDAPRAESIDRGLAWLAREQEHDGSWRPERFGGDPARRVGTTALVLLAFLGAGHLPIWYDPHGEAVAAGVAYLESIWNKKTGEFEKTTPLSRTDRAIALIALLEARLLRRGPAGAVGLQSSIDRTLAEEDPISGGWSDSPGGAPDTRTTTWHVILLAEASRVTGLSVPPLVLLRARSWFAAVTDAEGNVGLFSRGDRDSGSPALVAAGLHSELFLDAGSRDAQSRAILAWPAPARTGGLEGLFHAAAALAALHETEWDERLVEALAAAQVGEGTEAGSWTPDSAPGDRFAATAFALLALEGPFRMAGDR
ncbi:MAG: hypothetical protein HY720_30665 [Planctomycetes bacterium]|nr:hypothetical protein [Planctomycetota bacterium]